MHAWLLPESVEDLLPPAAERIERLRRDLLDLLRGHGYQLVIPPLIEYLDSLLTGTGHDLDTQTFKLVDPLSGRMVGVRADITPQSARVDAHLLNRPGITRLCYAGSVLHARPSGLGLSREPLQLGAEIYGHAGVASDLEIQQLTLSALSLAGVSRTHLDLGHVGIFGALAGQAGLALEAEAELFVALQQKDDAAIRGLTRLMVPELAGAFEALPELYGGREVLSRARAVLPPATAVAQALDTLGRLADALESQASEVGFDLAELRGYHYHSGVVFAVYAPGAAEAVALGGRYDQVGRAFGRARPATGFSLDLRQLAALTPPPATPLGILAPPLVDADLRAAVGRLRGAGEVVVTDLDAGGRAAELGCDRQLVREDEQWEVRPA